MSYTVIIAILMFVAMVVLVMLDKIHVSIIFTLVPTVAALLLGFSLKQIGGFATDGFRSVSNTVTMMVFAISYFGVLWEVGIFDLLIQKVLKGLGNSVLKVCFITALLSNLTQLDGSGSTTAICTIPPMKPIFEKMKIRREALMLIFSLMSGMWCMLPWTGGTMVAAAANNIDIYEMFHMGIPVLVFGVIVAYLLCIPIAMVEKKNGAGLSDAEWDEYKKTLSRSVELKVSKPVAIIDIVLTLALILGLLFGFLPSTISFMIFFGIAMIINFPSVKEQSGFIRKQAPNILSIASITLALGVLLGVTSGTGMVTELAQFLNSMLPASIAQHVLVLVCLITLPLACFIGSDNIKTLLMPTIIVMVSGYGISAVTVVLAIQTMIFCSANLTLFTATPYFALGLAEVSMRDHLKYSFLPIWGYSLLLLAFMVLTGICPL